MEVAQRVALEHPVAVQGLLFTYSRSWTKVPLVLLILAFCQMANSQMAFNQGSLRRIYILLTVV